ncbi:neoverrucotoxin subunit beta-like [Pseudophryne corroboree]|uniref:neoverrucotoxin subunit beta-like n=1 Tax=Pseudophryne corroboree TaxID=495146 RepID=UPI0030814AC2
MDVTRRQGLPCKHIPDSFAPLRQTAVCEWVRMTPKDLSMVSILRSAMSFKDVAPGTDPQVLLRKCGVFVKELRFPVIPVSVSFRVKMTLDVSPSSVSLTQENTSFDIIASDTVSDKSSALDVSVSIKASLLSGLIEVGGSALYLNDKKTSKNQARVTLKYSRTTRFEYLSMDHLGIQNMTFRDVFDKGMATHVVTGIIYGAQAFFIFDREVSTSESTKQIQENLQVMVRNIPSITTKGQAMNDKDKEEVKKFSCTVHGDFALERNPVTYEDAINSYTDLPKLLGEKGEKAVPVIIWLYPLGELDSKAARLVRDISEDLVYRTEKVIQQMIDVTIHCNDLMKHPAAETFPDIKSNIIQFREQCDLFTLTFKKQLEQILPAIRDGRLEEAALADILLSIQQSPFEIFHITQFLSRKEQEMDTVSSYVKMLSNIKVFPSETERNKLISDPLIEYVVCFNFASLNKETYLSDMCNCLQSPGYNVYENKIISPWFKDNDARRCLRAFQEFAGTNAFIEETQFIISSVPDQRNRGVSIYLYDCGDLLSEKFEPPAKPNLPVISGRTHDSMDLTLSPADFGKEFIEGYSIEYRSAEEENWSHFITNKDQKITVTGLMPNTKYQLRYSAMCKPGLSIASDVTEERTLPTSPPEAIYVTAKPSYITLQFKKPTIIGDGATITEYKVEYKVETENLDERWLEYKSGKKPYVVILERVLPVMRL